ncbi:MAG: hypothetical protein E3J57_00045 [Dehalococcoidia bacterium]|jgi:hypothetical protein|nr:MAG: hypothetical protein E3J57_00045 [Dehalococcoidia bacterium]
MWQKVALVLMALGMLALIGWSANAFFAESEIPLIVRIAVGAIGVGILILIGVAIKDRIKKAKTDEFKEVER